MVSDAPAAVDGFFRSYRDAFERFDVSAIADHFAYPNHTTSDTGQAVSTSVASRAEWIDLINQLLQAYRAIGVASAHAAEMVATELSPRLFRAAVKWVLHDAAGETLYRFDAVYTLADIDGRLRITAIAHNELPQLRAILSRSA